MALVVRYTLSAAAAKNKYETTADNKGHNKIGVRQQRKYMPQQPDGNICKHICPEIHLFISREKGVVQKSKILFGPFYSFAFQNQTRYSEENDLVKDQFSDLFYNLHFNQRYT